MKIKQYIHRAMNAIGRKVNAKIEVGSLHPGTPTHWTENRFTGNPVIEPRMRTK